MFSKFFEVFIYFDDAFVFYQSNIAAMVADFYYLFPFSFQSNKIIKRGNFAHFSRTVVFSSPSFNWIIFFDLLADHKLLRNSFQNLEEQWKQ